MDCYEYKERINLFVDGELDINIQMKLFKHLAVCQECRSFVDGLVRMKEARKKERKK
jgi:predicted anti-sigma-YlaC factor YlaD